MYIYVQSPFLTSLYCYYGNTYDIYTMLIV